MSFSIFIFEQHRVLHTLYLMRHGENTANVGWPVISDKQVVLSECGHEQAQRLAERLNHVYTTAVYISELQRNQQTAAPLCELWELLPQVLPCLNELCYLGCPYCQRECGRAAAHVASLLDMGRCTQPNADSFAIFIAQVEVFLGMAETLTNHIAVCPWHLDGHVGVETARF